MGELYDNLNIVIWAFQKSVCISSDVFSEVDKSPIAALRTVYYSKTRYPSVKYPNVA